MGGCPETGGPSNARPAGHYELYLQSDDAYADYLVQKGFPRWYPNGIEGFRLFCNEVRQQAENPEVQIFLGLEVYHGDFPDVREDFLEGIDSIGCHISKTESYEPWRDFLLHTASKLSVTAHRHRLIPVLFHPFETTPLRTIDYEKVRKRESGARLCLTVSPSHSLTFSS